MALLTLKSCFLVFVLIGVFAPLSAQAQAPQSAVQTSDAIQITKEALLKFRRAAFKKRTEAFAENADYLTPAMLKEFDRAIFLIDEHLNILEKIQNPSQVIAFSNKTWEQLCTHAESEYLRYLRIVDSYTSLASALEEKIGEPLSVRQKSLLWLAQSKVKANVADKAASLKSDCRKLRELGFP